MNKTMIAAILALALTLPAAAAGKKAKDPGMFKNGILTDPKGLTLYTFDKDSAHSGKSACSGPCVQSWPPLKAASDARSKGDWSVVARNDGNKQWAFKGLPVYRYKQDKKPGDTYGDNLKNVWHIVKSSD